MDRPTNYLGRTMTWDNTGSLTAIGSTSNGTIRYTYLSDGQHRTKTVNSKITTYRYNNGMLLSEQTGDETLRYYYDAAGKVASLTYKKAATRRSATSTPETYRETSSPSTEAATPSSSAPTNTTCGADQSA